MIPKTNQNIQDNESEVIAQRGAIAYFAIGISLAMTLYGVYAFLATILSNQWALYGTVIFVALVILFVEDHRTEELRSFLNSLLKNKIDNNIKLRYSALVIAFIITSIFVILDVFGSMQISDSIERMLIEGIATNSKEYKLLEENAKSGADAQDAYRKDLREYNNAKSEHYGGCDKAWRLPTYRTKNTECKQEFKLTPPTQSNATGTVKLKDYKAIEQQVATKVEGYKELFFYLFFGFSMMLNYFAVSKLVTQYRDKAYNLTPEVVAELQQREQKLKAMQLYKLQDSTNLQESKAKEKNALEIALEAILYDIELSKEKRTLNSMRKIPLAISNGNYIAPMREGYVGYNQGYNQTEPNQGDNHGYIDETLFD